MWRREEYKYSLQWNLQFTPKSNGVTGLTNYNNIEIQQIQQNAYNNKQLIIITN